MILRPLSALSRQNHARGTAVIRDAGRYTRISLQLTGDLIQSAVVPWRRSDRRIYFIHVRKTAGTSLSNAFLSLGGEDPREVVARSHKALKAHSGPYAFVSVPHPLVFRFARYTFGSSHLPAWRVHLPRGTFTITILRDPIERVISLYRYLADELADATEVFPAPAHERAWASAGFSTFLDRADKPSLLGHLYAFSPHLDPAQAAESIRSCSVYFFAEHYNDGLAALARQLHLPLEQRRDRVSVPGTQPTEAEWARLRELLDPEYRLLDLLRAESGTGLVGKVPPSSTVLAGPPPVHQ